MNLSVQLKRGKLSTSAMLLASLIALLFTGCVSSPSITPLEKELVYPDFQTFPSPRTFDRPGTVFRINSRNQKAQVIELNLPVTTGEEVLGNYTRTINWEFGALLNFVGMNSYLGSANHASAVEVKMELLGARRERTFDKDVEEALRLAKITFYPDSTYYIIREAISVSAINYELVRSKHLEAEAQQAWWRMLKVTTNASEKQASREVLKQSFGRPHYIFYSVLEIPPPGKGFTRPALRQLPVNEKLQWTEELDAP